MKKVFAVIIIFIIFRIIRVSIDSHQQEPTATPCNPICYPNSYDTSNPDCECNKE